MKLFNSLMIACLLPAQVFVYGQHQLTLEQMQEDFDQLANAYKKSHQGLYFYTDTSATNRKIDSLRTTLTSDLNSRTFFNTIAALVALTNEGHTDLSYSEKEQKHLEKQIGFLPLGVFFCGKNQDAIIKSVYKPRLKSLKGKRIISINDHSVKEFMRKTLPYIATDGFNVSSAYEWVAWDFPFYYYQTYGPSTSFMLKLEDIEGNQFAQTIKAIDYRRVQKQSKASDFLLLNGIFENQAYRIINDSVAYVTMTSFSGKDKKIKRFYQKIFSDIKKKGIQHLILDIQRHVGGSEGMENLLASYLFDTPFQKYKEVTAPLANYHQFKQDESAKLDQWKLVEGTPKRGNFTLMSNYYSEHDFKAPSKDLIYHGKVYVLTSGVTFSGGAEFASMLKMKNRAIFIGEEVGGAHEGNVSGYSTTIELKHSKISAALPYVHFKMNVQPQEKDPKKGQKKGQGVIPDYYIPQSWKDLNNKVNSKLVFALHLINKNAQ